jgi:hypothetical protein
MKRTILVAAVVMGVSTANFANAFNINNNTIEVRGDRTIEMSVETFEGLKFKLSVNNLPARSYIAIKSETGEVLYSEYTSGNSESYLKVFDLSNLLDGKYSFVVETSKGLASKPFSIKTETTRTVTPVTAE